jgi:hypothetical protein
MGREEFEKRGKLEWVTSWCVGSSRSIWERSSCQGNKCNCNEVLLEDNYSQSYFFDLGTSLNFDSSIGIGIGPTSSQIVAKIL